MIKKITCLLLSLSISFILFGVLNSLINMIDKEYNKFSKTDIVIENNLALEKIVHPIFPKLSKKENFHVYNYFQGISQEYKINKQDQKDLEFALYKKALLPSVFILLLFISISMIFNSLRYGSLTPKS